MTSPVQQTGAGCLVLTFQIVHSETAGKFLGMHGTSFATLHLLQQQEHLVRDILLLFCMSYWHSDPVNRKCIRSSEQSSWGRSTRHHNRRGTGKWHGQQLNRQPLHISLQQKSKERLASKSSCTTSTSEAGSMF